jgi:hypothetical protein
MKTTVILAAALTVITALAHVFGGTPEFLDPINDSNAPDFNKTGMTIIWHWITAVLCINTVALAVAGRNELYALPIGFMVILQFLAFGLLFAGFGIAAFGSLFVMPQWIAFFLISALTYFGLIRRTEQETIA